MYSRDLFCLFVSRVFESLAAGVVHVAGRSGFEVAELGVGREAPLLVILNHYVVSIAEISVLPIRTAVYCAMYIGHKKYLLKLL